MRAMRAAQPGLELHIHNRIGTIKQKWSSHEKWTALIQIWPAIAGSVICSQFSCSRIDTSCHCGQFCSRGGGALGPSFRFEQALCLFGRHCLGHPERVRSPSESRCDFLCTHHHLKARRSTSMPHKLRHNTFAAAAAVAWIAEVQCVLGSRSTQRTMLFSTTRLLQTDTASSCFGHSVIT